MLFLDDAENSARVPIRFPAGLAGSLLLEPTLMISLNDRNRPLSHSGALGRDVLMQQVESDHLGTQRTDALGKHDHLSVSSLLRLSRWGTCILSMRFGGFSTPKIVQ